MMADRSLSFNKPVFIVSPAQVSPASVDILSTYRQLTESVKFVLSNYTVASYDAINRCSSAYYYF